MFTRRLYLNIIFRTAKVNHLKIGRIGHYKKKIPQLRARDGHKRKGYWIYELSSYQRHRHKHVLQKIIE
jgi:hypothetical protein